MKHTSWSHLVLALLMSCFAQDVDARGGRVGGGARMSAARAAASRSVPANYGSLRSAQVAPSRSLDTSQYQGQTRTFETRRGGDVTAGVSQGGDVAVRGTTAAGREYAGVQAKGGDRVVAARTAQGDVVARARGDGDGVIEVLPNGAKTIYIEDDPDYPYYYYGYRYYWPYFYGGSVYYQEIYPPYGTTTTELPPEAVTESVGGTEYYVYDDVHYVKEGDHYVVSAPPTEAGKTTPEAAQPSPVDLTKAMCAHVGSYSNFLVESTEQVERPGKGLSTVNRRILVSRPGRISAAGREGSVLTHFWYDGKTVTTFDGEKHVYSSIEAPATIEATLDMLRKEYGLTLPLADLLTPDLCKKLAPVLDTMKYEGKETVSGRECHQLALTTEDLHAQLWIRANESAPLPCKVDVLYETPGMPRYVGTITKWESQNEIDPNLFVFQPPSDARKVAMLKRPD